ncbi:MAG TPA: RtcB family protein [Pyrinomonadaceae bacterium]|nr:RtcB family protein [Pyrinomonadaceae bacterium]
MDTALLKRESDFEWHIPQTDKMKVPGIIYASEDLIRDMDNKVLEQVSNVAMLPGIQKASFAMPDAHWGYGFPIGGVAAFDPDQGGVVSAGGVGFDISCGVRTLLTGIAAEEISASQEQLADTLFRAIPAGVGSTGKLRLNAEEMDAMLTGGAQWAVQAGYGLREDLDRIEEHGQMKHAKPGEVSDQAKKRQREEVGTLGSGNHYLEVQKVVEIYDETVAAAFGLRCGDAVVSIHCGSRGLGHQVGTDFLKRMVISAKGYGIELPDRELACAPVNSDLGRSYLGAMRAAINCALANREVITHLVRQSFSEVLPKAQLKLIFDVSHNTCKVEEHSIDGQKKSLFVHRKGATRAFGPGHPDIPDSLQTIGQPVLIGGTMGTASYVLVGTAAGEARSFSSSCHGAGRRMSRHQATKQWKGRELIDYLASRGIIIRSPSYRGVAEEAPGAYKDVTAVVNAADEVGLSKKVARLEPMVCVKG